MDNELTHSEDDDAILKAALDELEKESDDTSEAGDTSGAEDPMESFDTLEDVLENVLESESWQNPQLVANRKVNL